MKAAAVVILVVWYVAVLLALVSGHKVGPNWFPLGLLIWTPIWLEFTSLGFGRRQDVRPDPPDHRVALAGVAWSLLAGSAFLFLTTSIPDAARGGGYEFGRVYWILFTVASVIALGAIAFVGRPANWIVHWHAERAERLVRTEAALATARARVLQSQMQPHFLFNALNSVTALLREDPARAKAVLASLKGLMARTLETSHEPMTSIRKEVAFVRDQLAIEQERFHDRLRVSFDVPDDLLDERIPAFSLQPLAENALRHGIAQSIDGGDVKVRVAREGTDLVLSVENTGGGLSPGWREGTGLGNVRARLAARYGPNAGVYISQTGDRTRALIRIAHEPFPIVPSSKPLEV